jgi:hypothetical protein
MDPAELHPLSDAEKFLDLPYNDRWKELKPIIVKLYMGKYGPGGKSMTYSQVVTFMREQYSFYAACVQHSTASAYPPNASRH